MRIRALAPAKVNLCLFLGPIRADGRHELVTLFQSLSLCDALTLETRPPDEADVVACSAKVDGENLATRALAELRRRGWDAPPVRLEIDKRIPIAAGLAGGSADAAAALRLALAVPAEVRPRAQELDVIAADLGADVPSQLVPGLALGRGAGELVQHVEPLAQHAFVVLPSMLQLATVDVFRQADRMRLPRSDVELELRAELLGEALEPGARLPPELLVNDLQPAALALCPTISLALAAARDAGAEQAIVSGSGPTVIGIWWGEDALERARSAVAALADRFPGAIAAEPVTSTVAVPELLW
jgi:4-diphosphocytidyl-2-C-methyl-D-erythritol kinase